MRDYLADKTNLVAQRNPDPEISIFRSSHALVE